MSTNENRLKKAFYSSITSAVYQIVVIVCGFITSRLLIETYGSAWNGVIASITKFLSLFVIVEVGVNGATRVALYKSFASNDERRTSAIINANDRYYRKISFFLIIYVLVLACCVPLIINANVSYWSVFFMVIIIGASKFAENCWGINSRILLAASQSNYLTNIIQTAATIANAILLFIIVKAGGDVFAAKSGSSAILAVIPIVLFILSHRMFRIDKKVAPDNTALKGRWDVLANSLSNIVHENVDVFFITVFCSAKELSVYSMYYIVADGLTKVFQVITNGLEAGFGNMWARKQYDTLNQNLRQYEYIIYALSALLFGCMTVLVVPFMSVYMRNVTDVNYMRTSLGVCIAIAQIMMSLRTPYVLLVQAAGHYKQVKFAGYAEAGINIVLTVVLVLKLGIVGAIIGTIVANTFRTVMYGSYVSKHMLNRKFSEIVKRFIWLAAVWGISVGLSYIVLKYITVTGWGSWVLAAIITFAIHAAVVLILSVIFYRNDLKNCIALFKRLLKR